MITISLKFKWPSWMIKPLGKKLLSLAPRTDLKSMQGFMPKVLAKWQGEWKVEVSTVTRWNTWATLAHSNHQLRLSPVSSKKAVYTSSVPSFPSKKVCHIRAFMMGVQVWCYVRTYKHQHCCSHCYMGPIPVFSVHVLKKGVSKPTIISHNLAIFSHCLSGQLCILIVKSAGCHYERIKLWHYCMCV